MILGSGGINWGHYADIDIIEVNGVQKAHVNRVWRQHYGEGNHPETVASFKINEINCPIHDTIERFHANLPRVVDDCEACEAHRKRLAHSVTIIGLGWKPEPNERGFIIVEKVPTIELPLDSGPVNIFSFPR